MQYSDRAALVLALAYCFDRFAKFAMVAHFFRRLRPQPPARWPSVTLIQPVTRGKHNLQHALASRWRLHYAAALQHVLVCDSHDNEAQKLCQTLIHAHPHVAAQLVLVEPDSGAVASKIAKLEAGLAHASGDVLCFVDDDVALWPDALEMLIPHVLETQTGAAFGLACYSQWSNIWSSMMSAFVNANALFSYIPLSYLVKPYTITGHCFALRRDVFEAVGGFANMEQRIDDDHELARRVRAQGLACVQTPLVYDVDNVITTAHGYHAQMKRWFVFPRQTMAPYLSPREQLASTLGSAGMFVLPLLALLGVVARRRTAVAALGACLAVFLGLHGACEHWFLRRRTPIKRWPLLVLGALINPIHILCALLAGNDIEWRGQRLRVYRGGVFEVLQ